MNQQKGLQMNSMKEKIWEKLASNNYNGFFITAEIASEDQYFPESLETFIFQKLDAIQKRGISARKFIFREANWRIYLTFFPRNSVVSEQFALKNRIFKQK